MTKDIRREQLALLKFEKQLTGLAATLAAGSAAAASVAQKSGGEVSLIAYKEVETALVNLAEATGNAHASIQEAATEAGLMMFRVTGGAPKDDRRAVEAVQSILGLG